MRWESEKWRKLYRRVDAAWARLPVLARGLGSELLKYAEDDGRIPVRPDEDTGEAVCCLMGARRAEWKAIEACVEALLGDGYIVREEGAILIRNFAKAQARSSTAERQARYRRRHATDDEEQEGDDRNATSEPERYVTGGVTSNGQSNAQVTDALRNEVTDRALCLSLSSDTSGSLSADSQKEVPVTARARDSEERAKPGGQVTLPGVSAAPVARRRKVKPVERPMPADWQPTEAHRAYAAKHGVDLDAEVFGFRGWAEGRTQVSWNGAFATRLSNAVKWAKERAGGGGQRPVQYGRGAPAPDRRQPGSMASGTDPEWENFQE